MVERSLRMWKAPGSIPGISTFVPFMSLFFFFGLPYMNTCYFVFLLWLHLSLDCCEVHHVCVTHKSNISMENKLWNSLEKKCGGHVFGDCRRAMPCSWDHLNPNHYSMLVAVSMCHVIINFHSFIHTWFVAVCTYTIFNFHLGFCEYCAPSTYVWLYARNTN